MLLRNLTSPTFWIEITLKNVEKRQRQPLHFSYDLCVHISRHSFYSQVNYVHIGVTFKNISRYCPLTSLAIFYRSNHLFGIASRAGPNEGLIGADSNDFTKTLYVARSCGYFNCALNV